MTAPDIWPEPDASARPIWLVTLADLSLLLVGFFVLVQANRAHHRKPVGTGLTAEAPLPVAAQGLAGFAPGSATLPSAPVALTAWAAEQLRDPRTMLTVTGATDGTPSDVDPATGSGALLAADRARAVAAHLAPLAPARIAIATTGARGRAVTVTLAFAGERNRP